MKLLESILVVVLQTILSDITILFLSQKMMTGTCHKLKMKVC